MSIDKVLARIDNDLDSSLDRLFELIRYKSISADPAHSGDCLKAANWCADQLTSIGIEASVRKTIGHPMVVGHYLGAGPDVPHILFYGHYDVQPVDPLDEWTSDPFEPSIVEVDGTKRITGRGASDDKGQMMTFVEAARAWHEETGGLPVNLTVLLEGEEESSSPSMVPFLTENVGELKKDIAFVCDTRMWDARTPAITTRLRGLMHDEVIIGAASHDLHSGLYGNAGRNPIHLLAKIIADMRDDSGRITLSGFYDGVPQLSVELKNQWEGLGFDEKAFLDDIGLSIAAGEEGYSVLEQIWARPTMEVNGIVGGYTGPGSKTVIPAEASAKFTFRLVGDQDPEAINRSFRAFVKERLPADCSAKFLGGGGERAVTQPEDSDWIETTRKALTEEWDREAVLIGMGGSIPIVTQFKALLGMDTVLVGFGLDDRIHSPNEKYDLSSFHGGARSWARILGALAGR